MPICITCSTPVQTLYTTYSKADDRTLGKGVRLTQCPNCKRFADKYVEHDYVVLFIDLVLIKPQVYRHLLFNRLGSGKVGSSSMNERLDPSILRLGTLLVLFDVYITWARIERSGSTSTTEGRFVQAPLITQYLFFLTLNVLATLAQHGTIRLLAHHLLGDPRERDRDSNNRLHAMNNNNSSGSSGGGGGGDSPSSKTAAKHSSPMAVTQEEQNHHSQKAGASSSYADGPGYASPSAISTALLVSSCTKLFPILLVIWPTSSSSSSTSDDASLQPNYNTTAAFANRASSYIGWVVLFNNIEALLILLDCGYVITTGLAVAGILARWVVEGWLLAMVGLSRDASGPVSDCMDLAAWFKNSLGNG